MLRGLLEGIVEEYVEYRLGDLDGQERSDKEAALHKRVEEVEHQLYDDRLRRRYALKKTSKAPAFAAIEWDIKTKIADGTMPELERFPYATCRIAYQRGFDNTPWSVLGNPFESTQINLTIDEVRYVIRVLQTIQNRLESAEQDRES